GGSAGEQNAPKLHLSDDPSDALPRRPPVLRSGDGKEVKHGKTELHLSDHPREALWLRQPWILRSNDGKEVKDGKAKPSLSRREYHGRDSAECIDKTRGCYTDWDP
ncbi:hypothetical protein BGZ49_004740, partial [Haplosporangium sp. Z 27]